jgi:hypothetical protein
VKRFPVAALLLAAVLGTVAATAASADAATATTAAPAANHASGTAAPALNAAGGTAATAANDASGTAGPAANAAAAGAGRAAQSPPPAHPVVLVGIPGLRWSDVSAAATPTLWRLAGAGSVGNLVVHATSSLTCPADGWLTLNAGARAGAPRPHSGTCAALPAAVADRAASGAAPAPADIRQMPALIAYNRQFHYSPDWGLLARAAGPGRCSTAIGPGAALALAGPSGRVSGYLPSPSAATRATFARCPLTVVDLGPVPAASAPGGATARSAAVRADDRALRRIDAELPAGSILVVSAPADDLSPHLRLIVVDGPGYAAGVLNTASTRQPGLTQVTDVTASVLHWRGLPVPPAAVGADLTRGDRGSLSGQIRALVGQDTATQVYRTTFGWFFAIFAVAEAVAFGIIVLLWRGPRNAPRRRAAARTVGVAAACVPAGTFLASLVPWWMLPHPAVLLYVLAAAWAAVLATIALTGPWRRDPLGPAGIVCAITVAVVGLDVMTGSRLELNTPFGLNVLWGGRFYGEDNNTVGIYGAAAILCAAWLASLLLRRGPAHQAGRTGWRGPRGQAVLAASAVALFAVVASGWPGFGGKVGGTIAVVPGLLLLIMAIAGVRITWRRVALLAVSGALVIALFALVNYFAPVTGHSDIGAFAGQALHGQGGGTLQRKISTNLSSLTATPFNLIIPAAVVALGVLLLRPQWFLAGALNRARQAVPLLGISLTAIWVVAVLGWFAEDSGVAVPGAMLPLVLPLAIAIVASAPQGGERSHGPVTRQAILEPDLPP